MTVVITIRNRRSVITDVVEVYCDGNWVFLTGRTWRMDIPTDEVVSIRIKENQ